jgi:hypothetical protein
VRLKAYLLFTAALAGFGCSSTAGPIEEPVLTMQNISALYYGVTLNTEKDGAVTDQIMRGVTIELILASEGSSRGQMFIPADTAGGADTNVSLLGSWVLDGNVVTLSQTNDSFLKDMTFVFEQTHLTGETVWNGVTYRAVLAL